MAAGKGLTSLLASLEEHEQLIQVISSDGGRAVSGTIVAGNADVMWLRERHTEKVLYVLLASVFYIEEIEE